MAKPFFKFDHVVRPKKANDLQANAKLSLNAESTLRLQRLKKKIPKLNEEEIIDLALKHLELRTDRILKKQINKKITHLKKRGVEPEKFITQLKDKGLPVP